MKKILLYFVKAENDFSADAPMSPARREKYTGIRNPEARAQHMASSRALHAALGDGALTFRYGANGRPEAEGGYVSLSHTGGIAVCAACDAPVGVDIERVDRRLSGGMRAFIGTLDEWLAREACVKLTGEGLSGIKKYRREGGRMADESGARIAYVRFFDHGQYRIAVCCGEEFEIEKFIL